MIEAIIAAGLLGVFGTFTGLVFYGRHLQRHPEKTAIGQRYEREIELRQAWQAGADNERMTWEQWLAAAEPEPADNPEPADEDDNPEPEPADEDDDCPDWTQFTDEDDDEDDEADLAHRLTQLGNN